MNVISQARRNQYTWLANDYMLMDVEESNEGERSGVIFRK